MANRKAPKIEWAAFDAEVARIKTPADVNEVAKQFVARASTLHEVQNLFDRIDARIESGLRRSVSESRLQQVKLLAMQTYRAFEGTMDEAHAVALTQAVADTLSRRLLAVPVTNQPKE